MDTTLKDTLARIEQIGRGIEGTLRSHGDMLRMMAERQEEIVKLLTPEPKDGPSLDELIGHMIGQLTELTGYARQIAKAQTQMEQNLPGDVARAVVTNTGTGTPAGGNGAGANGAGRGSRA